MRLRLTKTVIDAQSAPESGNTVLYDTVVTGLNLRISARNKRTWSVFYRTADGRQRNMKLGDYPVMTPDLARTMATRVLSAVSQGKDPAHDRKSARAAATVAELARQFLANHADSKRKSRTASEYRRLIERHIVPELGTLKVDAVTHAAVQKLHRSMSRTPRQANLTVAVLSAMMNYAIRNGLRTDGLNPVRGTEKFKERARDRFLSDEESRRLLQVLDRHERNAVMVEPVLAIRLLMLTGRRVGEILCLKWSHLDLDVGLMRLPDSKVGASTYHLSPAVVALLRAAKERQDRDVEAGKTAPRPLARHVPNEYVVRGRLGGAPMVNIEKPWRRIREGAGIPDVRLHDLRHTYASKAAASGASLLMIKELLGHNQIQTTTRYAHLVGTHVRSAVQQVDQAFGRLLEGDDGK
jgi:integrase